MNNQEMIYDYEQILLGKKKNFSSSLFNVTTANNGDASNTQHKRRDTDSNQKNALVIFRYAVEKILCWSPRETKAYLSYDILDQLKLTPLLQYLCFPPELSKTKDMFYIAHLLYPNIIKVDERDLCIKTFQKTMSSKSKDFPKNYFLNAEGFVRTAICLQYVINNYIMTSGIEELYALFADVEQIDKILDKYKLLQPCYLFFDNPIDYLHFALPESQQNPFHYYYYRFQYEYSQQV